jgi:tetratricopeptide (TPR) repeat protein
VGLWPRLSCTGAVTLAVSALCWWVLRAGGVDQTTAVTAAAGLAAVMVTLGAVWVSRAGDNEERTNSGDGESGAVARAAAAPAVTVTSPAVSQRDHVFPYSSAAVNSGAESDERHVAPPSAGAWASPIIVGDIPQEAAGFQPRTRLFGSLLNSPSGVPRTPLFVVIGPRGVGKSQLAAAYARKRLTENWHLVAWMSAEDQAQLLAAFEQLADALDLTWDGQDSRASALRVRHWLEADGSDCLLVLDNAASADQVRPFLPSAGQAQVIVTSSFRSLASLGTPVQVDVFTREEATAFLHERTGRTDEGTAVVAEEVGYLPLALAHAAAVIRGQHLDYLTYAQRLVAIPVAAYLTHSDEDPYPCGTAEAILLSMMAAEEEDPTGLSRQLLETAALLSAAGIRRTILHAAVCTSFQPWRRRVRRQGRAQPPSQADADRALQSLVNASLMTWSIDGSSVTSHRLVMRVARERASRTSRLSAAAQRAIGALNQMQPSPSEAWRHEALAQELIQHIIALSGYMAQFPDAMDAQVQLDLLRLRSWAGWYLNEVTDASRAIPLLEQSVTRYQQLLEPDHPSTLGASNDLARAYRLAGRLPEAIGLHEQNLAAYQRTLGPDHISTLGSADDLGRTYRVAGRLEEAVALHEQNLAAYQRTLGPDHPDTLAACNHLARAYRAAGRLDDAIPLYEQTVADRRRVLGDSHARTLVSINNLADAYRVAGRVADAIPLLEQNLADRRRVLSDDHPDTLTSRNNLGRAYQDAGRVADAIPLLEQNLADRRRVLSDDHPDILVSVINLADAYKDAGRLNEAVALLEHNVAQCERLLGADHLQTQTAHQKLRDARQTAEQISTIHTSASEGPPPLHSKRWR